FLIFLIVMIGYTPLTHEHTLHELAIVLPDEAFDVIQEIVAEITNSNNATLLSFSMLGTLWTASRGTSALIKGMNKAYNVKESRPFWKGKGLGIIFTICLAFIILFSLALLVFGELLGAILVHSLGLTRLFEFIWEIFRYAIPLLSLFITFALLYRFGPNCQLSFKSIYLGAIFATLGWIVISLGFAYYVNNFANYTKIYGSIGGVMILLIWLYLSSLIALLGAEINSTLKYSSNNRSKHTT
ncbi:MAG: YihY/virulence factor BrkB family protein, partial [Clostridiaceae bacterium]|nr:YihY/virulence factor BrkB family protein [Clostridiaceae bacterium]